MFCKEKNISLTTFGYYRRHFGFFSNVGFASKSESSNASIGFSLLSTLKSIFSIYRKTKNTTETLWRNINLRRQIFTFYKVLRRGRNVDDDKAKRFCKSLIKHRNSLWLFCHDSNIAPTNNHAERQIRHAVIWRKKCFGTQSQRGILFVERILSVIKTCQHQSINCFDFIKQSLLSIQQKNQILSLVNSNT